MSLLCAILGYAMAAFNLYRGLNWMNVMNYIFAVLWLCLGIFYTVKYCREKKHSGEGK